MQLKKADLLKRFVAVLIDGVISIVPAFLPIVGGIIGVVYTLTKDGLMFSLTRNDQWKNMSIGKKVMGIRVVKTDGTDITMTDSVKRNIILAVGSIIAIVPVIGWVVGPVVGAVLGLIEAILVLVDKDGRRLGDKLAGTCVVEAETVSQSTPTQDQKPGASM